MKMEYRLPIRRSGVEMILELDADYVAEKPHEYLLLSEAEVSKCKDIVNSNGQHTVVCPMGKLWHSGTASNCLIALLEARGLRPPTCSYVAVGNGVDMFIPMREKNAWLYSFAKEKAIRVEEDTRVTPMQLQGAGILKLTKPCSVTDGEFVVMFASGRRETIEVNKNLVVLAAEPLLPVTFNLSEIPSVQLGAERQTIHDNGAFKKAIQARMHDLESLHKEITFAQATANVSMVHQSFAISHRIMGISWSLSSLSLVVIIVLVIWIQRKLRGQDAVSVPATTAAEITVISSAQTERAASRVFSKQPDVSIPVQMDEELDEDVVAPFIPPPPPMPAAGGRREQVLLDRGNVRYKTWKKSADRYV